MCWAFYMRTARTSKYTMLIGQPLMVILLISNYGSIRTRLSWWLVINSRRNRKMRTCTVLSGHPLMMMMSISHYMEVYGPNSVGDRPEIYTELNLKQPQLIALHCITILVTITYQMRISAKKTRLIHAIVAYSRFTYTYTHTDMLYKKHIPPQWKASKKRQPSLGCG